MRLDSIEAFKCNHCGDDHIRIECTSESPQEAEALRDWVGRLRREQVAGIGTTGYFNWMPFEPQRNK